NLGKTRVCVGPTASNANIGKCISKEQLLKCFCCSASAPSQSACCLLAEQTPYPDPKGDKGDLQSLIDKLVNEDSSPSEARSLQPSSSDLQKYNWLLNKYGPYVQYGK
uniref:Secreted protein n=1 Tax=Macrostomum lignano TaxID=282301 RepID=A0A1I8G014_9PLAT